MTPTLLLFVKVVLDSHDLLCFHVNFRIVFLLQWEMPSVLMEIALNPHITLTGKSILSTYLSNPRHSHRQQYVNMSHQRKADENHGEISLHRRKGLASVCRTHQWDWNWCSPSGNSVSVLHSTNYTRPTLSIYPDQVKSETSVCPGSLQHFSQQPSDGNNVSVRAWMDEFTKNLNMYTHTGMSFSLNKEWNLAIVDTWMSQENVTLTDIVR
jgi:hypothetical protein